MPNLSELECWRFSNEYFWAFHDLREENACYVPVVTVTITVKISKDIRSKLH